jgi:hypothetical protein
MQAAGIQAEQGLDSEDISQQQLGIEVAVIAFSSQ